MKSFRTLHRLVAAAAVSLGSAALVPSAMAGTTAVSIASDPALSVRKLGSYDGTATFDTDTHKLTVVLHNTSARGTLTGMGFSTAGAGSALYEDGDNPATRRDEDVWDETRKHTKALKPFKAYDSGATMNGKWPSPGAGRKGIKAGQSLSFVFDVSAADTSATAMDLLSNPNGPAIVAAFRGFKHQKQDRVGALLTAITSGSATPVVDPIGTGGDVNPLPTGGSGTVTPPATGGGSTSGTGGSSPTAVPLPAAAWPGLAMLGVVAATQLRRRILACIA